MNSVLWGFAALVIIVGIFVGAAVYETGSIDVIIEPFKRIVSGLQNYQ